MYVASTETMRLEKRDEAYIGEVLKVVEEQVKNEEQAQMQAWAPLPLINSNNSNKAHHPLKF